MSAVTEEEMQRYANEHPGTTVIKYDDLPENTEVMIPDVNDLSSQIVKILEFMNTDELVQLMNTDKIAYEQALYAKFPEFSDKYYVTFKLLLDCDNIERLTKLLMLLDQVKQDKINLDKATAQYDDELAETYVYPTLPKDKLKAVKKEVQKRRGELSK